MGILKRFKDIMSSNINALLDKAEDPEKMIDQYLRDLQEDLRKVKSETATVMAEEQRCKRQLDECDAEIRMCFDLCCRVNITDNSKIIIFFTHLFNLLYINHMSHWTVCLLIWHDHCTVWV